MGSLKDHCQQTQGKYCIKYQFHGSTIYSIKYCQTLLTCLLKASLRNNWLRASPDELLKVLEVGIKPEVLDVANNGALMLNVENKTSVRVVEFNNNATNWDISIKKEANVPVHPNFVFLYTHSGKIVQGSMDGSLVVLVYEQCNDLYDVSIFLGSIGATNSCQHRFRCRQRALSNIQNTKYFTEVWDRSTRQLIVKKEMTCKPIFKTDVVKCDQSTVLMWNEEKGNLHVVHVHEDKSIREYFSEYLALKNGRVLDFRYPYALISGYMEVDGNYAGKLDLWELNNMEMKMWKKGSFAKDISIVEEAILVFPHIALIEYDLKPSEGSYNFSVVTIDTQQKQFISKFGGVHGMKYSNGFIFIEVQNAVGPVIKMYDLEKIVSEADNQKTIPRSIPGFLQTLSKTHIDKVTMQNVVVHTNSTSIHIKVKDFWSLP